MTDTNKEREAFEAWAAKVLGDNPMWRESGPCELAWQSWQARASLSAEAEPTADTDVKAWFVPHLHTFKGAERVHFTRAPGCTMTDAELIEDLEGRVMWLVETFCDSQHSVTDKFGVVHHAKPLYLAAPAQAPAPGHSAKHLKKLRKALIRAQQAINSMKVEAETAAQGDKRMMLEACETISNEGLQADMAIRDALAAPSSGKGG